MSLKRLTPTIKDLGYLRLWRDELEEIVALVRQQLGNETIVLESNDNELDDVGADLPKLGSRLRYFTVKVASKPEDGTGVPREILTVNLKNRCQIEATNPDVTTRGLIGDIEDITRPCRRLPLWYPNFSGRSPISPESVASRQATTAETGWTLLLALSIAGTVFGALTTSGSVTFGSSNHRLALGWSLAILIPSAIILMALLAGNFLSRTILFTGTRQAAPTFWQRNAAGITINVVVAALFLLFGWLIAHA